MRRDSGGQPACDRQHAERGTVSSSHTAASCRRPIASGAFTQIISPERARGASDCVWCRVCTPAGNEVIVTDPQKISDRWPQIQAAFSGEGVTISLTQAMNLLPKVQAALDGPAQPRPAQPTLDLSTVRIVNAPDVRGWAETARITKLSFDGASTRIEFTKQDGPNRWPDLTPPGWEGPLQYTMWLFLRVNGEWVGSGSFRCGTAAMGPGHTPIRRAVAVPRALVLRVTLEPHAGARADTGRRVDR